MSAQLPRRGEIGTGGPPPGPRNFPLLGAAGVAFDRDPLERFTRVLRRHGDVCGYRLGPIPLVILGHPDDIQSVLVGEHHQYMKDELTHTLARFVGRGLLTSEGAFWRRQRRIAAPSFQRRHIERFAETMVDCTRRRAAQLGNDEVRDVHADMMALTLDIVLHTLFGSAAVPDEAVVSEIVGTLMEEFQATYLTWRRLLPNAFHRAAFDRMNTARAQLDAMLYEIIEQRRADDSETDDLLGRLIAARDEDGSRMTDVQLRDEVATVFLAGHETTALALSFALLLLARHPLAGRRLRSEVDQVLGTRPATMSDVPALTYTDAVVRESMRLYPPAYIIGREALEERRIGGYTVPRGAQVLMPQWYVHRDARWYEAPNEFLPERWLSGLADRLPRFAYFPFGGGARVCVGNHFAQLEAVLALATLAQHIEVAAVPDFKLELLPSVTLRPKTGVRLRVSRRATATGA